MSGGAFRATFVRLTYSCGASPEPLLEAWVNLGGLSSLFSFTLPVHTLHGNGGVELYHTFLNRLAMAVGGLQAGNPSDVLVPFIGSKRGVCLGPSHIVSRADSYSYRFRSTRTNGSLPLSTINHVSDSPKTRTRASDTLNVSHVRVLDASVAVSGCPSLYFHWSGHETFIDWPSNSRIHSCLAMSFSFFDPYQRN